MGRCQHAPTVCVGKNYVDNASVDDVLKIIEKKEYQPLITKYIDFNNYKSKGGYLVLNKFINKQIKFDEIKDIIAKSNLKGKGGAGFPTFKKWEFVLANPEPRYLTINADEGEVGEIVVTTLNEVYPLLIYQSQKVRPLMRFNTIRILNIRN